MPYVVRKGTKLTYLTDAQLEARDAQLYDAGYEFYRVEPQGQNFLLVLQQATNVVSAPGDTTEIDLVDAP